MVPETLSLLFSHYNHYNAWKSLVLGLNHVHSTVFARVLAAKWTMYPPDVIIYLTSASLCKIAFGEEKKRCFDVNRTRLQTYCPFCVKAKNALANYKEGSLRTYSVFLTFYINILYRYLSCRVPVPFLERFKLVTRSYSLSS
jgi:hypothetical protein